MKNYKLIFLILLSGVISCEKNHVVADDFCGENPKEEDVLQGTKIIVRPSVATNNVKTVLTEGKGFSTELLKFVSQGTSNRSETITIEPDFTLVDAFNHNYGSETKALPTPFFSIDGDRTFEIGKNVEINKLIRLYAKNPLGNVLKPGNYVLPLRITSYTATVSMDIVYYNVIIREPFMGNAALYDGEDAFFIFYLDTKIYDPRLVTDYYMGKADFTTGDNVWYGQIGNIINLKTVTIGLDINTGRALLNLSEDVRYVLDNYIKYLLPLKDTGRKICLSIEGGHSGIGFCNLTDSQIEDFVHQVRRVIQQYDLDGVNLWDKNSGYDIENAQTTNTQSYPKLIKKLRESLGDTKLITITDYEWPTSYFGDLTSTGGIEVGNYIDYAWSGYNARSEGYQVVDPYHQGEPMVSQLHPRNPIKGLPSERYICINAPWTGQTPVDVLNKTTEDVISWVASGYRNNQCFVYEDIRTWLLELEGGWNLEEIMGILAMDFRYQYFFDSSYLTVINGSSAYGKWLKDW